MGLISRVSSRTYRNTMEVDEQKTSSSVDVAFTLPSALNKSVNTADEDDDYDDEADKKKGQQQIVLAQQKEFQTESHIPTHEQVKHGITKKVLINNMSQEERTALKLDEGDSKKRKGSELDSQESSQEATPDLLRQQSETLRKKAKLTTKERQQLDVYKAFTDTKLEAIGSVKNKELLDGICDKHEKAKLAKLFDCFDPAQEEQYVNFRRSHLQKKEVKKIMQTVSGTSMIPNVIIAVSGIAKVYAGGLIEQARILKDREGDTTSCIEPRHIREAMRVMENNPNIFLPKRPKYKKKLSRIL